jgi:ADP-heptose:LPS heptosyltransferase
MTTPRKETFPIRTIITCPGLGDTVWLFMKLVNQSERFHWKIGDGLPQRGHQIFELFPQLVESFEYIPDHGYNKVKRSAHTGKWSRTPDRFYLEANSHLERGNRIEEFLPDLETSYRLEYATSESDKNTANEIIWPATVTELKISFDLDPMIGIYTSAYSNARHWKGWEAKQWLELIRLIQKHNPNYKFVFIGADYDIGVSQEIMKQLQPSEYVNTICQPLPVVIEILKRLDCFIGFPSGLSIINETLGAKQTVMFYPVHLSKLINAWPDPARIESGAYKGCLFCEPKKIFGWLVDNNKI